MATINDVAKRAGVSVATVSRVINGIDCVQPKTVEAVNRAVDALNYRPNAIGRNLRKCETNRIIVVQPSISNLFYSNIVRGIERIAHEQGYQIMLCDTDSDPEREGMYLDMLDSRVADGAILVTSCHAPEAYYERSLRHPIVHCCEDYDSTALPGVTMDNVQAAYDAVTRLIALGHRRIGFFTVYDKPLTPSRRLEGYRRALEAAGIAVDDMLIVQHGPSPDDVMWEASFSQAKAFAQMASPPTALFCTSDMIALAAIQSMKAEGLRVPDDLSVIGFDDIEIARRYDPTLSTVYIPKHEIGRLATELLLKRLRQHDAPIRRIYVKHKIIERETTRLIPPISDTEEELI